MTVASEVQGNGDIRTALIQCLERLAADSAATIFTRFEAVDLLLRLATGPRSRSADSADVTACLRARIALSDTVSFLDEIMTSNDNRARIRLHAASLALLVRKVSGWYC